MSPKGRKPRRPHHRPHDQRHAQARAARETIPPDLMKAMLAAGKDMVRGDGPLEAEMIASAMVGIWWGQELIDADVEEVIGEALVAEAARRRTAESLTLLTALASVASGRLAVKASTAAQALDQAGVTGPEWLAAVGHAEPAGCYRSWDESGDAASVIGLFAHEGRPPHAVSVLVDRNLGGLAKDAWVTPDGSEVVERYLQEAAASDHLMTVQEVEPTVARALVEHAFGVTERASRHDPPVSAEVRSFRALALARMRLLPEGAEPADLYPEDDKFRGEGRTVERRRFLASAEVAALGRPRIVAGCLDGVLDHSELYDEERLLRVSPVKAEILLCEWLPTWVDLSASQVDVMAEVLRLWSRQAATRAGLPAQLLTETLANIDRFAPDLAATARRASTSSLGFLRDEAVGRDVWERAEAAARLTFALLAAPDRFMFDPGLDTVEDDLHELAARAHPESDDELREEGGAETQGGTNPALHLMLHEMIASQLWQDDPPEVWQTARRLQLGGYDQHEIHHMLASAVVEPVRRTMVEREPFDLDLYATGLSELPGSWEAQRPT